MVTRHFEPYTLTIAALFALAAGLTLLWTWPWTATAWLAICAGSAAFASWHYAHAPLIEDDEGAER